MAASAAPAAATPPGESSARHRSVVEPSTVLSAAMAYTPRCQRLHPRQTKWHGPPNAQPDMPLCRQPAPGWALGDFHLFTFMISPEEFCQGSSGGSGASGGLSLPPGMRCTYLPCLHAYSLEGRLLYTIGSTSQANIGDKRPRDCNPVVCHHTLCTHSPHPNSTQPPAAWTDPAWLSLLSCKTKVCQGCRRVRASNAPLAAMCIPMRSSPHGESCKW